jgi:uncharacterized protein (TIGR02145 family)
MPRALLLPAILFLLNCSKSDNNSFIDSRDNQRYKFTEMGDMLWMAENLNYKPNDSLNSWCYNDDDSNCRKYGRLYGFDAAKKVCPEGWHLPSHDEWNALGWDNFKNSEFGDGAADLGFFSSLGGCRKPNGEYLLADKLGYWWLATMRYSNLHHNFHNFYSVYKNDYPFCNFDSLTMNVFNQTGYSVRCVKRNHAPDTASSGHFKDYETSTTGVDFRYAKIISQCSKREACGGIIGVSHIVSIAKTETGAFAKYSYFKGGTSDKELELEAELSMEEWQDFIKALYNCCVANWENFQGSSYIWKLSIHSSDEENIKHWGGNDYALPNWRIFEEIMHDIEIKIREKAGAEMRGRPWEWW